MNRPGPSQGTSMTTGSAYDSATHPLAPQSQGSSPGVPSPGGVGFVGDPQQTNTPGYPQPPLQTKLTRPSAAIQSNADYVLQLVMSERSKIDRTYQDKLHRLETQFQDHKRKANEEREDNRRRDKLLMEEIARLKAEVEELREEKIDILWALEEANLEFIDGGVKPKAITGDNTK